MLIRTLILSISLWALNGCQLFEYTPYATEPYNKSFKNLTFKNIEKLTQSQASDSLVFAVISDPHYYIDDIYDANTTLNTMSEIDFVFVIGDFTKFGLLKEFELFASAMTSLRAPYFTTIGNHESVAEGKEVYTTMFGSFNYSFTWNNYKIISANTNGWHFDSAPDFNWLEEVVDDNTSCSNTCTATVILSHIAPWGDQFTTATEHEYIEFTGRNNILLSIHGHQHNYSLEKNYQGHNTDYILVDDLHDRNFLKITLKNDTYTSERVYF